MIRGFGQQQVSGDCNFLFCLKLLSSSRNKYLMGFNITLDKFETQFLSD